VVFPGTELEDADAVEGLRETGHAGVFSIKREEGREEGREGGRERG